MSGRAIHQMLELTQAFEGLNQLSVDLSVSDQALDERLELQTQEMAVGSFPAQAVFGTVGRPGDEDLSTVLEALPAGIVVLNEDGVIRQCNGMALEFLGSPLLGEAWRDVITRAFVDSTNADAVALNDGRLLNITTNPLGSGAGQVLLLRDVTESCALQEMMTRHQRLLSMGEMLASLAHQIRTPLASSLLYLSHLDCQQLKPAQRQRSMEKIRSCLQHLEHVVGDMLLFAKGGQLGSEIIPIDELLQELQQIIAPQLIAQNCEFSLDDNSNGASVQGNRVAILGVLQNLLSNGLQACEIHSTALARDQPTTVYRSRLTLRVETAGAMGGSDTLRITVSDNGCGMTEDIRGRVFEPFYTTKDQGTGLGLAVVQAIIHGHHGAIWLESEPGKGTTFAIELPRFQAEQDS